MTDKKNWEMGEYIAGINETYCTDDLPIWMRDSFKIVAQMEGGPEMIQDAFGETMKALEEQKKEINGGNDIDGIGKAK